MNNWAGPKYMLAEGDTYMKYPDDETFPQLMVNYVKLDRVPKFNEWTPVVDTLRAGDYFVTSGEVLFRNWSIEGAGAKRTYTAEAEWTFPPEFAELVWSDGKTVDRQVIDLKEMAPSSSHKFRVPFDAAGKRQVIIWHPLAVVSLDPATGKVNWQQPFKTNNQITLATPVMHDSRLLITSFYNGSMMLDISKSLKPGGRCVFVEFRKEDPDVPIKLVHKMTEEQVKKEITLPEFGLKWSKTISVLPWQHIVVFEKKP